DATQASPRRPAQTHLGADQITKRGVTRRDRTRGGAQARSTTIASYAAALSRLNMAGDTCRRSRAFLKASIAGVGRRGATSDGRPKLVSKSRARAASGSAPDACNRGLGPLRRQRLAADAAPRRLLTAVGEIVRGGWQAGPVLAEFDAELWMWDAR